MASTDYVLIRDDQHSHNHHEDDGYKHPQDMVFLHDTRLGFLKKVYGILSFQLALTVVACILIASSESLALFFLNPIILILSFVVQLSVLIPLLCSKKLARTVPTNYILLGIFTFAQAIFIGAVCSFYDPTTVLMAAIMTLGVVLTLTVYTLTSKIEFKSLFAILLICLIGMLFTGIFSWVFGLGSSYRTLYCGFGVIVYGIYLIFDTKLLADGKYGISHEDYIFGALILYIDILQIFVFILRIIGKK